MAPPCSRPSFRALTPADGDLYAIAPAPSNSREPGAKRHLHDLYVPRANHHPTRASRAGAPLTWMALSPTKVTRCSYSPQTPRSATDGIGTCSRLRPRIAAAVHEQRLHHYRRGVCGAHVDVHPALDTAIAPGTLVRVVRRARYELYRASDSAGISAISTACRRAQRLQRRSAGSGPFAPGGIRLSYLDRAARSHLIRRGVARIGPLAIAERRSSPAVLDSLRLRSRSAIDLALAVALAATLHAPRTTQRARRRAMMTLGAIASSARFSSASCSRAPASVATHCFNSSALAHSTLRSSRSRERSRRPCGIPHGALPALTE